MALVIAASTIAAVTLQASFRPAAPVNDVNDAEALATVTDLSAQPRLRRSGLLYWADLTVDTPILQGDAIYVPEGSEATLTFDDDTRVTIGERSLVVIDRSATLAGPVDLALVSGTVRSSAGTDSFTIHSETTEARVHPGSEVNFERLMLDGPARLSVLEGGATLKTPDHDVEVKSGEARSVTGATLSAAERLAFRLLTPGPSQRVEATADGASVTFSWTTADDAAAMVTRVEVSTAASFATVGHTAAGPSPVTMTGLAPGLYHWRVVSDDGSLRSDRRVLRVIPRAPPVPLQPRPTEVVYLPPGSLYTITWGTVPGAARYRVEIATEAGFTYTVLSDELRARRKALAGDLEEGIYRWRVRAVFPDGSESRPSDPVPFRIITKPLPAAPALLSPELKITPAPVEGDAPEAPESAPGPEGRNRHGSDDDVGDWLAGAAWSLIGGVAHAADGPKPAASIILRWTSVPGITRYGIQIAEDRAFTKVVVDTTTSAPYFEWPKIARRDYWWRVRSIDAEGRLGEFSPPKKVAAVFAAPALLEPPADAAFETGSALPAIVLTWKKADLARAYEVEVDGEMFTTSEPKLAFAAPRPGTFQWRVRSVDAASSRTPFSPARRFTVSLGTPTVRGAGSAEYTDPPAALMLRWSEVAGADGYEVEIVARPGGRVASHRPESTSWRWVPEAPGRYFCRVRARSGTITSPWSEPAKMDVRLGAPAFATPAASAPAFSGETGELTVRWNAVPGATGYLVSIASGDEPATPTPLEATEWTTMLAAGDYTVVLLATGPRGTRSPEVTLNVTLTRAAAASTGTGSTGSGTGTGEVKKTTGAPETAPTPPRAEMAVVGAAVGAVTNFGPVLSPYVQLHGVWHIPVWGRRLGVVLRAGYHQATQSVGPTSDARARMDAVLFDLGPRLRFPLGRVTPYVAITATVAVLAARLDAPQLESVSRTTAGFGGAATAGVGVNLGPGRAFVEVRYGWLRRSIDIFQLDGGGLSAGIGYRLAL